MDESHKYNVQQKEPDIKDFPQNMRNQEIMKILNLCGVRSPDGSYLWGGGNG